MKKPVIFKVLVALALQNNYMKNCVIAGIALISCVLLALPQVVTAQSYEEVVSSSMESPEYTVMGFGDISYVSRDGNDQDGFFIGQAVGHLVASLTSRFGVFAEVSATGKDSEYTFEVERLIAKYEFSDLFKLSAGRYHTPIGYWNSAFHHGAWLQTTTSRPEMVKFGSKLLPIHFVGVLMEGNLTSSRLGLSYSAGFGNGRHVNIARAGDAGDINGDKAWMVQVQAAPDRFYGLNAGLGFYSDEISPDDRPDIKESTFSAFVAYTKESPEIIIEYMHSSHENLTDSSVSGDTNAWYAQFAYRLKDNLSDWKPYVRYENTDVDDTDPLLFDQGLDYDAGILGVRWDFNSYAALKAEYRAEEFDNNGRENNFRLQLSFVLAKL